MTKYGTIVNLGFNPMHKEFKNLLVKYFGNPTMTKVTDDFNNNSVYMVQIQTMLLNEKRFLIVNVPKNPEPLGNKKLLSQLDFKVLQTKELDGTIKTPLKTHSYSLRENNKAIEYQSPILLTNRTKKYTEYDCKDYDVKITMIHKEDFLYEFPDQATLFSAIEKYSTLIFIP